MTAHLVLVSHSIRHAAYPGHGKQKQEACHVTVVLQGEKLFALEEWVELANGCLCCTMKDDFLRALEALMEQRQRFDYILVETTGIVIPYLIPLAHDSVAHVDVRIYVIGITSCICYDISGL